MRRWGHNLAEDSWRMTPCFGTSEVYQLRSFLDGLIRRHSAVVALLASGLTFYNGYRIHKEGDRPDALGWWIWAGAVLVAYSAGAYYYKMWTGLFLALAGIAAEILLAVRADLRG